MLCLRDVLQHRIKNCRQRIIVLNLVTALQYHRYILEITGVQALIPGELYSRSTGLEGNLLFSIS